MSRYRRTAHTLLAAALLTLAAAIYLVLGPAPWLIVPALFVTMTFAWAAGSYYARDHRHRQEHEWARRAALGYRPPPLHPCCLLAEDSDGAAHDPHRCTRAPEREAFDRIVARYDTGHGTAA
ncbi:hypothetical protein [Streptomyces acidiscabies]|uniref:Uncharacterized protein n=1 Tax=Streptomyces acidiscabies TaxID=42234 RepID=A0ABU4LW49_9ACTN|nr:hypothetical protein [Streptomyces acidiscabies]MDX3019893.1 hypothetical protein [Streptomyces acidiscabies]GAQ52097.1 hypothetical protein a10_01878 [Streptomyces acidiscabies]